jgi:hypothetical protein
VRLLWTIVPQSLFDSGTPDFRSLALDAIDNTFGTSVGFDETINHLTVIFKRLRNYERRGRIATSLDLENSIQASLFDEQNKRCNHCLYEFKDELYWYSFEEDGYSLGESTLPGELVLDRTFRRPELDHIIPYILGGDSEANWQILCKSCNLGKSDQISYLSSIMGSSSTRAKSIFEFTPGKRYAAIAEIKDKFCPAPTPFDGKHFRVFKKLSSGLTNPENLRADYC